VVYALDPVLLLAFPRFLFLVAPRSTIQTSTRNVVKFPAYHWNISESARDSFASHLVAHDT
jgi:hypothetical protein